MDVFSKITISHFVWYLVPGLALIFFVLFPFFIFDPHLTKQFFQTVGPFGIIIIGIILGFAVDGLRLYRFRPKYSTIRERFFQSLKASISSDLDPYFIQSNISDVAKSKNITGLSLHHAIWIMLGHFTVLAFLEAIFWMLTTIYFYFSSASAYYLINIHTSRRPAIVICAAFAVFFLIIGFTLVQKRF